MLFVSGLIGNEAQAQLVERRYLERPDIDAIRGSKRMKYLFEDVEINEEQRQLRRSGEIIQVEPKILDVLVFLIENREKVVSRQELLDACWPGIYVSDGALSRCLSRVRQALGQSRSANKPIQTSHGRGYRFVSDVEIQGLVETQEQSDVSAEDGAASAQLVERRFVSLMGIDWSNEDWSTESAAEASVGFSRGIEEIAESHECTVLTVPGGQMTIQVGFPRTAESAPRLATTISTSVLSLARAQRIALRITVASGMADLRSTSDSDSVHTIATGLRPLRVAEPLLAGEQEFLVDSRTAQMLAGSMSFKSAVRQLDDGSKMELFASIASVEHPVATGVSFPFVGRAGELLQLDQMYASSKNRKSRAVLIRGSAGIGKSELVKEFLRRANLDAENVFRVRCSQYHSNTPFYPMLLLLRLKMGIAPDTSPLRQLRLIEDFFQRYDRPVTDHLPLLASLLSISETSRPDAKLHLDAERRHRATVEAIVFALSVAAGANPLVLWIDDFQWVDKATLATLQQLIVQTQDQGMLVTVCERDDADARDIDGFTVINLAPLDRIQTTKFLNELSTRDALPMGMIEPIADRSEGVPLFLTEIARLAMARADDGDEPLALESVPDELRGLLTNRLESLGSALALVQWSAVIGKTVPADLLSMVSGLDLESIQRDLAPALDGNILQIAQRDKVTEYRFEQGLMRDAAYESMLMSTRRQRHLAVAETLEHNFPYVVANEPEQIAIHYSASTEPNRAAKFWPEEGGADLERKALQEALHLYHGMLELSDEQKSAEDVHRIKEIEDLLSDS